MHDTQRMLIIGASGFCGNGVLSAIQFPDNMEVYAHIRPTSSGLQDTKELCMMNGHTAVICPISELNKEITRIQPTIVCSFIGTTKKKMQKIQSSYNEIDFGINQQLMEMLKQQSLSPLFIYVSSMGVEWHTWSKYLEARHLVETQLRQSDLPHIIIRPGILSGPTRRESRLAESFGAQISRGLCGILDFVGLEKVADGSRPLSADQMGRLVKDLAESWVENGCPSKHHEILLITEIFDRLRQEDLV